MNSAISMNTLATIGNFSIYTLYSVSLFLLAIFAYKKFTKYDEVEEIKKNNRAVAIVLSSAILSIALIMSSLIKAQAGFVELAIWSGVGLASQFILFSSIKFIFPQYIERLIKGEDAIAIGVAATGFAIAMLNAACIATP